MNEDSPAFYAVVIGGIIGIIVFLWWLVLFLGAWKSVPPDKLALNYTGGPVAGTHFKSVVNPGTHTKFYANFFLPFHHHLYYLPSTQRTYIISADPNVGDKKGVDTIAAPSQDNVLMNFEATVYFKLNTDSKVIRQFFEQICLHDHCTDLSPGGGWDQMLAQYFRPQIEQAIRTEAGKYPYVQMWHDPNVRAAIQQAIAPVLASDINNAVGGNFFCGPDSTPTKCTPFGFVLQAATPPGNVVDAYSATAASQQLVQKATQDAAAKVAAADGDRDAQNARAQAQAVPPAATAYIRAQAEAACAARPDCHLVIVEGSSSNVQVNGG